MTTYLKVDLRGVQGEQRVAAIQKAEEQQCERRRTRRWKTNECVERMKGKRQASESYGPILMHLPRLLRLIYGTQESVVDLEGPSAGR